MKLLLIEDRSSRFQKRVGCEAVFTGLDTLILLLR
jgi:hypothetical protein